MMTFSCRHRHHLDYVMGLPVKTEENGPSRHCPSRHVNSWVRYPGCRSRSFIEVVHVKIANIPGHEAL